MSVLLDFIKSLFNTESESGVDAAESGSESYQRISRPRRFHRNDRIEKELLMIAPRFVSSGGIFYDEKNNDWLMIPKYPLPERWKERWCKLMIVFPSTYPDTPPIGFYLNKKFHLKHGQDNHFTGQAHHGAPDLLKQGWHWYCVTMNTGSQGGWHPSADYTKPDNLWTFLNMVRESLTNDF